MTTYTPMTTAEIERLDISDKVFTPYVDTFSNGKNATKIREHGFVEGWLNDGRIIVHSPERDRQGVPTGSFNIHHLSEGQIFKATE